LLFYRKNQKEKQLQKDKELAEQRTIAVEQAKENEKLQVELEAKQQNNLELEERNQRIGSLLHGSKNTLLQISEQVKDQAPTAAQQLNRVAGVIKNISETHYPPDIHLGIDKLLLLKIAEYQAIFAEKGITCYANVVMTNIPTTLNKDIKNALYRISEEAINNICKHAAATEINIDLFAEDNTLVLTIADNGVGFDLSGIEKHIGLREFDNFMFLLGGQVQIDTDLGKSTIINFTVPIK
jgi:two-component system, NarL family, sensor kinase